MLRNGCLWFALLPAAALHGQRGHPGKPAKASAPLTAMTRPVMSRVTPDYPELARRMHLEGLVTVQVTAQRNGSVTVAHALTGHPLLAEAAEACVRKWRFLSAPAASTGTVVVVFSLAEAD